MPEIAGDEITGRVGRQQEDRVDGNGRWVAGEQRGVGMEMLRLFQVNGTEKEKHQVPV